MNEKQSFKVTFLGVWLVISILIIAGMGIYLYNSATENRIAAIKNEVQTLSEKQPQKVETKPEVTSEATKTPEETKTQESSIKVSNLESEDRYQVLVNNKNLLSLNEFKKLKAYVIDLHSLNTNGAVKEIALAEKTLSFINKYFKQKNAKGNLQVLIKGVKDFEKETYHNLKEETLFTITYFNNSENIGSQVYVYNAKNNAIRLLEHQD